MRLSITKYVDGLRKNIGSEGFSPSELYAFLVYLHAKSGLLYEFHGLAVDAAKTEDDDTQIANVKAQIDRYVKRLLAYGEYLLPFMAAADEDIKNSTPVELPLLKGYFGKGYKLPDGSPLCVEGKPCLSSLPDIATPIQIMNDLDAILSFSQEDWEDFLADTAERAKTAAKIAVPISNAPPVAEAVEDVAELSTAAARAASEALKGAGGGPGGDSNTKSLKWAIYGAGAGVGLLALYKLLK